MIKHVRQFIARIVDTRVSEAVIDLHRSMQHLEINNDERHKVILNCLDKLSAKVQLSGDNAHNAVIASQVTESHGTYWAVLTDAGNVVKMTDEEIDERFYRGEYIMKARDVEARYAKATGIPHV